MPPYTGKPPKHWGGKGRYMEELKALVRATYGEHCWLCDKHIPPHQWSIDHVVPRSVAPELTWVLDNLRPAHSKCNKTRGTRTPNRARQLIANKNQPPRALPLPSRDW